MFCDTGLEYPGFNPRLPCGRRRIGCQFLYKPEAFQSTPPMREATQRRLDPLLVRRVSIHASHAGGDLNITVDYGDGDVSIHASHAGGDVTWRVWLHKPTDVSIHASHAGGDHKAGRRRSTLRCFNPRLPCGRRQGLRCC